MKKLLPAASIIVSMFIFSSCGVNSAMVLNANHSSTQVNLSSNNYKVVDRVSGTSTATYIFMLGGLKHKQLHENAYSQMMEKAKLTNGPRAIVNAVTEEHIGGVPPFYVRRTVTVSANVIEFTK